MFFYEQVVFFYISLSRLKDEPWHAEAWFDSLERGLIGQSCPKLNTMVTHIWVREFSQQFPN